MITATSAKFGPVKVDGVVNLGGWSGKRWLIGVGCGYSCLFYLVGAGNEGDAVDELVDSCHGHVVKVDPDHEEEMERKTKVLYEAFDKEKAEEMIEEDFELRLWRDVERAGNYGEAVDLEDLRVFELATGVNFFAPKDSLDA